MYKMRYKTVPHLCTETSGCLYGRTLLSVGQFDMSTDTGHNTLSVTFGNVCPRAVS